MSWRPQEGIDWRLTCCWLLIKLWFLLLWEVSRHTCSFFLCFQSKMATEVFSENKILQQKNCFRAIHVFLGLSLWRIWPSYRTFFLVVFQRKNTLGRRGHMIKLINMKAHFRAVMNLQLCFLYFSCWHYSLYVLYWTNFGCQFPPDLEASPADVSFKGDFSVLHHTSLLHRISCTISLHVHRNKMVFFFFLNGLTCERDKWLFSSKQVLGPIEFFI